jgi:hypothetical protein
MDRRDRTATRAHLIKFADFRCRAPAQSEAFPALYRGMCYTDCMSKELKQLLKGIETWPLAAQQEAAASLQSIKEDFLEPYELTTEDRHALERSAEDVRMSRFASDDEMQEFFDLYRRP